MERRRVGTISMAVVLIGLGILIFIAQVNKVSAVELGMKFWPMILLLLGGEILWASYRSKDEDIKIRYDILSVFMVILIVGINLSIYGIIETGIINKINSVISSETFNYQIPMEEIGIGDDIKKIVIDSPGGGGLTLRTGVGNNIVTTGFLDIVTDSEEKAEKISKGEYIRVEESGDTAYIYTTGRFGYGNGEKVSLHGFNIVIPGDRNVEIRNIGNLELILDNVQKDWIIDGVSNTEIVLEKDMDLNIQAFVNQHGGLKGNANWKIKAEDEEAETVHGELIYGKGSSTINILNSHEVVVNQVK